MGVADKLLKAAWRKVDRLFSVVDINPEPVILHNFGAGRKGALAGWRVFSDANFGGLSKAELNRSDDGQACVFSGQYSRELPDDCTLVRSGYCGINFVHARNQNLQPYDYLEFRVRGDGHTYVTSVRVDQLTGGDEEAWQAPLPTRPGGEWQDVRVQLKDFIFSFRGRQLTNQEAFARMPQHNVVALGITLSASEDMPVTGDFRLEIQRISAGANQVHGEAARRRAFAGNMQLPGEEVTRDSYGHRGPRSPPAESPAAHAAGPHDKT